MRQLERENLKAGLGLSLCTSVLLYLASVADKVYIFPTGAVFWMGFGGYHPFQKKCWIFGVKLILNEQDHIRALQSPIQRTGFTRDKEQYTSLLTSIQKQLIEGVAEGRDLSSEKLYTLLESSPIDAKKAQELGLVDTLSYEDQFEKDLEEFTKSSAISLSTLSRWMKWNKRLNWYARSRPKIAVLHLSGAIHEQGEDGNRIIQDRVCQQLQYLKANKSIRAVVLLVNSPGGSAQASEGILREESFSQERNR